MDSIDAYSFVKVSDNPTPFLGDVPVAVVLSMDTATERRNNLWSMVPCVTELCGTTIIQLNKGFKTSKKPDWVTSPNQDLVHSYYNVFCECTHIKEPILILEDDVRLSTMADIQHHFDNVNSFVKAKSFDIYSLGSIHFLENFFASPHRRILGPLGGTQASIWSFSGRKSVIDMVNSEAFCITMIDLCIVNKLKRKFTYKFPLTWQCLYPNNWELVCINTAVKKKLNSTLLKIVHGAISFVGLDQEDCEKGWNVAYYWSLYIPMVIGLLLMVTVVYKMHRIKNPQHC